MPGYTAVEQQDAIPTEDKQLPKERPARSNLKRFLNFGWWWEVYAVALAIVSTAAIVAVLLKVDAKPITSWSHSIQPASLVAIFSTIAKSALLVPTAVCLSQLKWSHFERPRSLAHMQYFDDASRGPWGALLFLWKTRGTALLASVGALTVVLMTTFETFSQQAIHLTSKSVLLRNETGFITYNQDFSDVQFAGGSVLSAEGESLLQVSGASHKYFETALTDISTTRVHDRNDVCDDGKALPIFSVPITLPKL